MNQREIMPTSLRLLANEIKSPDDIPAMCLRDAADMIEEMAAEIEKLKEENETLNLASVI